MPNHVSHITPLERSSTADGAAAYLRSRIAEGTLAPGERISEGVVAEQLGISRSPIREALARLALEGLVDIVPYKGTFVKSLDAKRLKQLVELRLALEEFAVRRLVYRASKQELDRFTQLIDDIHAQAAKGDFDGTVEADLRAHQYLIEVAGNPLLTQTYGALLNESRMYIRITSRHYGSMDELATEFTTLLVAMRERRADDAAKILADHIMHGLQDALLEIEQWSQQK